MENRLDAEHKMRVYYYYLMISHGQIYAPGKNEYVYPKEVAIVWRQTPLVPYYLRIFLFIDWVKDLIGYVLLNLNREEQGG